MSSCAVSWLRGSRMLESLPPCAQGPASLAFDYCTLRRSDPVMLVPRMARRDKLQGGAERLLADIREIKAALADEEDPDAERHLKWLLKGIHRKVTRHRVWLESLREDPRAGSELEAQIALFLMIEHECRANEERERPA